MEAGRRFLTSTAEKNFDAEYQDSLSKLIDLMLVTTVSDRTSVAGYVDPLTTTASAEVEPETEVVEEASDELPAVSVEAGDVVTLDPPVVPLELEVSVLREVVYDGRPIPVPVQDGQVLRDGVGRSGPGDNLKIQFAANQSCHVYAVWIDATAWATPIFPAGIGGHYENPVEAGELYTIPAGSDWLYLDDHRGIENLYFVASHEPLTELGLTLASFVGREREFRQDLTEVAHNDQPAEIGRGLAGVRPGQANLVQASDGSSHEVVSTSFVANFASGDLVVHRWFDHQ